MCTGVRTRRDTLLTLVVVGLVVSWPLAARPRAASATTSAKSFLFIDSEAGDPAGYGQQNALTPDEATFAGFVGAMGDSVQVEATLIGSTAPYTGSVFLATPGTPLQTGTYQAADGGPRLSAGWLPGYCAAASGSFTITDFAASGSTLLRLAASFQVHCDQATGDLRGEVRFDSTEPVQARRIAPLLAQLPDVRADRVTDVPFTVTNPGDGTLDVTSLAISSSAGGQLALVGNGCNGASLVVGGSCGATLRVSPAHAGSIQGTLRIVDTITPTGRSVAIGVKAARGVPSVSIPQFGTVTVGQSSGPVGGYIGNNGDSPLTLQSISVGGATPGDFTVDASGCGPIGSRVLQPFSVCPVTIWFSPQAEGARSATVHVVTDWGAADGSVAGTGAAPPPSGGYWMVDRAGHVYPFGNATYHGTAPMGVVVDIEPTPSGGGYWLVNSLGLVRGFGDAADFGGTPVLHPNESVTSISRTRDGGGYWLFTTLGRVIAYGDAPFLGDMDGIPLNGPVLDSIPTASGSGYYMVASDGGIFTFGDAVFLGSMGGTRLNAPVQSLVPDGDGSGYWLVASDGGIFAFDAGFYGSMGDTPLNRPITGMVASGSAGYLMVGEDGGIFAFGSADFFGSLGDHPPPDPITSVAVR